MGNVSTLLTALKTQEIIRAVDFHFSNWLKQKCPQISESNQLLAALVSHQLGMGHICVHSDQLSELISPWPEELRSRAGALLAKINLDSVVLSDGAQVTPLVYDFDRYYLYRYWKYECDVASWLRHRVCDAKLDTASVQQALKNRLNMQFDSSEQPDWQKVAAMTAVTQSVAVISGGPGTGKTTTVAKMLAIFLQQWVDVHPDQVPIIHLSAPTGKAAARLSESISLAIDRLALDSQIQQMMPKESSTLHRLLGVNPSDFSYRYNRDNPLHTDLLIVDEASMVDLSLMSALIQALPKEARLILIGDKHQLASVEAGSVMGDLCQIPGNVIPTQAHCQRLKDICNLSENYFPQSGRVNPFADAIAQLKKSYRFSDASGIGALSRAVNSGDTRAIKSTLESGFKDLSVDLMKGHDNLPLIDHMWEKYRTFFNSLHSPREALSAFSEFQVLCGLRKGPWGVESINQAFETRLLSSVSVQAQGRWYEGRAVMITRNEPSMGLFNGDIGVAVNDPESGRLKVWFELGSEIKGFATSRIPSHETVFAMTVHKSQGSEFREVTLVLVEHSRVLSRELVYTGITRAKEHCRLYGNMNVILEASATPTVRMSGLAERLWG